MKLKTEKQIVNKLGNCLQRVIIYGRVPPNEGDLGSQEHHCREYAAERVVPEKHKHMIKEET